MEKKVEKDDLPCLTPLRHLAPCSPTLQQYIRNGWSTVANWKIIEALYWQQKYTSLHNAFSN